MLNDDDNRKMAAPAVNEMNDSAYLMPWHSVVHFAHRLQPVEATQFYDVVNIIL